MFVENGLGSRFSTEAERTTKREENRALFNDF